MEKIGDGNASLVPDLLQDQYRVQKCFRIWLSGQLSYSKSSPFVSTLSNCAPRVACRTPTTATLIILPSVALTASTTSFTYLTYTSNIVPKLLISSLPVTTAPFTIMLSTFRHLLTLR
ncbi:hypothetical protein E2C01_021422 [Portunus trituberculatus]|uniref:Uncharacterized protein n=1 Tax=Portunus trituberculatus TaxID=210409 RepID=A0A5B7E613_PORTR|nr:hypothetical protein [Portunus trituberculatus]